MVFNILSIKITISWSTISTIREHIAAEEALAGACEAVGVYEAADVGIVITALQVIEPRLEWKGLSHGVKIVLVVLPCLFLLCLFRTKRD